MLVINKKTGAIVEHLNREDFELEDNGAKLRIDHFSRGQSPLSIILLADARGGRTTDVIASLRRNVAFWLRRLGPEDEMALMAFGADATVIQDFTKNHKLIAGKLRGLIEATRQNVEVGQDRIRAALQAAEHISKASNPGARRVVITITDDADSFARRSTIRSESVPVIERLLESGTVVYAMVTEGEKPSRFGQAARTAAESAVYTLGNPIAILAQVGAKMGKDIFLGALNDRGFGQVIEKSGGLAMTLSGEDSAEKFALLIDRLRNRYVAGFAPAVASNSLTQPATNKSVSDIAEDARFHKLKVTLTPEAKKRVGDVSLIAAPGYLARKPQHSANQGTNLLQKPVVEQGKEPVVEQGSPDELNGVMKVFVDTNAEMRHRADIVKEIQKKLPVLEIVSKPEDADIHLKFSLQRKTQYEHIPQSGPLRGVGKVVKVVSNNRVRLLLEYEERYRIKFGERNPAGEFAKEFVKAYLGANGKG